MNQNVNNANLYVETIGSGDPVLIMHGGLGLSHDYLRPYFDSLAQSHTVIFYDHFGNGRSEKPQDFGELSFDRLADDAATLMTGLGHSKFTLIGHSFGGFIAQEFAAKYADRLDKLVLIDTVPAFDYHPSVSGTDEQMEAFGKAFSAPMTSNQEWRETWAQIVQMYFHKFDEKVGADLDARTHYEYRAWNAGSAMLGEYNTTEKLAKIDTKSLVIGGRHDGITPPEPGAERIATLLPNAELVIFENSGHYPFIEERELFSETLINWLNAA